RYPPHAARSALSGAALRGGQLPALVGKTAVQRRGGRQRTAQGEGPAARGVAEGPARSPAEGPRVARPLPRKRNVPDGTGGCEGRGWCGPTDPYHRRATAGDRRTHTRDADGRGRQPAIEHGTD